MEASRPRGSAGPDPEVALEKYRDQAELYDHRTRRFVEYRERAIDRLRLKRGQTVLDVACGTGINFAPMMDRVRPSGQIVGVDLSREMLNHAQERVERHGWRNVALVESAVEDLDLGYRVDAALFSLTHDVLQSDAALAAVARHLKPGAQVVSFGAKWPPVWNLPVRVGVWLAARRYVTTLDGLNRPWAKLEPLVPDLEVEPMAFGGAYLAAGTTALSADAG